MQTLAQAIIYGTVDDVRRFIEQGENLNELDEYGYTPLVQTGIVNQIDKSKVILQAGADVDFSDLTGRTALHWAVDNHNVELSELLLSHGADANAYTRGSQPVLTMPYLRHHQDTKKLLYKHGASLDFAQDFVNAKLLGHRFELEGRVDIVNHENLFIEVDLEGFFLEFSLALVSSSLRDYKANFTGKHLRPYFNKLDTIITALDTAAELMVYQHYLTDKAQYQQRIDQLLDQFPLLIPTAYAGHAISLINFGNVFIRCDRGAYGRDHGSVIIYQVDNPSYINKDFVKNIIYKRQHKDFIDHGMQKLLKLKPIDELPLSTQISGNCSWANVEAVVPAMMYLLLLREGAGEPSDCKQQAMQVYEDWLAWDKQRALSFAIQKLDRVNPARKASACALLAAIMFQTYDFDNEDDRLSAEVIINKLRDSDYIKIFKAYKAVFQFVKDDPLYANWQRFMRYFELD